VWAAPAQAQPVSISILNPKFDIDVLTGSPVGIQYGISGWVTGPQTDVFKASTAQYPGASPTGLYCAALGSSSASGSIFQALGATLQANTTYLLTLEVGSARGL
jgi:hypothetical protein